MSHIEMRRCVLLRAALWNLALGILWNLATVTGAGAELDGVHVPHLSDVLPNCFGSDTRLPRLDPVKVGHVTELNIVPGKVHRMVTKATKPPLFEIDDFLTPAECDEIIRVSKTVGLSKAGLHEKQGNVVTSTKGRKSNTTFLDRTYSPVFRPIQQRLSDLTGISLDLLYQSEPYQIVHYEPGGHYHSHYDGSRLNGRPCCHHTHFPHSALKCEMCRYMTVIMYLNTAEEGGGTAFPLADDPTVPPGEHATDKINLSRYCDQANIVVYPKKGRAVMWYNYFRDDETGWLGDYDTYALHGGCDVIKGEKWIFTSWIDAPPYADRFKHSIFDLRHKVSNL